MATNELNTRIILKNDDTAAWKNNAPTLKRGEVGIVFDRPTSQSGTQTTMLVGNGNTNLDLYAKASDVYSWAKASTKPAYSTSEIRGMTDYVTTDNLTTTLTNYVTQTKFSQLVGTTLVTSPAKDNQNVNWDYFRAFKVPNAVIIEFSATAKTGVWKSSSSYKIFKVPTGFVPKTAFNTSLEIVQHNNDALLRNGVTIGPDGWAYVLTQGNSDFTRMKGKIIIPSTLLK